MARSNEDKEIFEALTSTRGGLLNRNLLPSSVKDGYDYIAYRAEDLIAAARRALSDLPPIHFDFIHNPEINAVAFSKSGRYFIGINTGAVFMLHMIIGRMLADRRSFQSVGDPSEEQQCIRPISSYLPNADVICDAHEIVTPRNIIRRNYASFLKDQAIMFLIGHEIAHISRGHVDYLYHACQTTDTSERSETIERETGRRIERQAMEQDADRRSIRARIGSLHDHWQHDGYPGAPSAPEDKSPERLIRDWAASISVAFILFGQLKLTGSNLTATNHPPLALRQLYLEQVAAWVIASKWDGALELGAIRALVDARNDVHQAFATALGQSRTRIVFSQSATKHMGLLQNYWNEILVDRLRPFSYEF